ncbi:MULTISPECIES: hypothetical protein [unclassified Undibacterium]|uniref:hypothetical protein n=1 Tax=unclassified Undibacterium TaxID=2630295 RepID=UPI002AC914C6|nr:MULTISPECIES: hypothetical protein [unclassified Undibacterium]MEB0138866.1 hypothetical protein [Undibacterium sp. CCC2.1]MEB0172272.1 hypothetical protein [Undibacterium sp. CCC1.1]MEB0176111.1 hypothetical protein [Undibacterium sp. CCC3.4]MEB0215928.1 hypothetical protein [Undibacterium sp. 5I2]WPX44748.1 hypothetical protein RHM61_05840 [Undibacterium sp. CCC3.4]
MKNQTILVPVVLAALLSACGGGSSSTTSTSGVAVVPPVVIPPVSTSISGVAATGAAILNASVTLTSAAGSKACSITDASSAAFVCDTTGLVAPFLLTVSGVSNGTTVQLSSASTSTAGTTNITPITNAIVATTANADPAGLDFANFQAILKSNPSAFDDAKKAYQTLLGDLMTATGNQGADLVSGKLVAGNSAQDTLLDAIHLDVSGGSITISTMAGSADDTPKQLQIFVNQTPAQVATGDKTQLPVTATVGGVSVDLTKKSFSAASLANLQLALKNCFSSMVAVRNSKSANCGGLLVDDVTAPLLAGVPSAYLAGGSSGSAQFSSLINDAGMDNAVFSLPQIIRVNSTDSQGNVNKVWLNFTWVRSDGLFGSLDTVAQIVTAPSTSESGWRLVGNQRTLLSRVRQYATRRIWLNPANATTGTDAYTAELQLDIGVADKSGTAVDFAIVTGPGLPAAGMLLRPSSGVCSTLNLSGQLLATDISGDDATVAATRIKARANCANKFRFAGVAIDPAKQSQFIAPTGVNWLTPLLTDAQLASIKPFSVYHIRTYQGGVKTVPSHNYEVLTQSAPATPTSLRSYRWQDASAATLAMLKPSSASAFAGGASFPVSWTGRDGVPAVTGATIQILTSKTGAVVSGSASSKPLLPGVSASLNVFPDVALVAFPAVTDLNASGNFSFLGLSSMRGNGLYLSTSYEYDF